MIKLKKMFKSKKFLKITAVVFVFMLLASIFTTSVYAGEVNPCDPKTQICNPLKSPNIYCFISDILKVVMDIGAVVAAFFIIYAGFLFVTARGNKEQLEKAKWAILGAVIGTAILLGAQVLSLAVSGTVGKITGSPAGAPLVCPT